MVLMGDQHDATAQQGLGRLGGTDGNEALTSAVAVVLTLLLAAEGITILNLDGLRGPHMLIGMALIGPVLVKLGSTGYRAARYYSGARPYREKGPPQLALRLLAPVLVVATVGVFGSGVGLLIVGHRSDLLKQVHQVTFIVWGACFVVHFLAYLPRMARSLSSDWTAARRREVRGGVARVAVVAGSLAGGAALALALAAAIARWHGGDGG
jgi:hypothetical protein